MGFLTEQLYDYMCTAGITFVGTPEHPNSGTLKEEERVIGLNDEFLIPLTDRNWLEKLSPVGYCRLFITNPSVIFTEDGEREATKNAMARVKNELPVDFNRLAKAPVKRNEVKMPYVERKGLQKRCYKSERRRKK